MKVRWGKSTYGMMRYLKRVANGQYQLKWQGDTVDVKKVSDYGWDVSVNGDHRITLSTLTAALWWVDNVWGAEEVDTYNMLNPKAGVVKIARKQRGGCCDPATERYHCM